MVELYMTLEGFFCGIVQVLELCVKHSSLILLSRYLEG